MSNLTKAAGPLLGFFIAVAVGYFAVVLGGGGHGWITGIFSLLSFIGAPLVGMAWCTDASLRRRKLAIASLCVGSVADIAILSLEVALRGADVWPIIQRTPLEFTLWLLTFLSWQVVALVALKTNPVDDQTA